MAEKKAKPTSPGVKSALPRPKTLVDLPTKLEVALEFVSIMTEALQAIPMVDGEGNPHVCFRSLLPKELSTYAAVLDYIETYMDSNTN